MLHDIGIADLMDNRQVNRIRQKQVVELVADFVQHLQRQIRTAAKGQIYIRTVPVSSLGARTV